MGEASPNPGMSRLGPSGPCDDGSDAHEESGLRGSGSPGSDRGAEQDERHEEVGEDQRARVGSSTLDAAVMSRTPFEA